MVVPALFLIRYPCTQWTRRAPSQLDADPERVVKEVVKALF